MVNINKIKTLAKNQGITIAFICKQLGNGRGYLNDVANGKNTILHSHGANLQRPYQL